MRSFIPAAFLLFTATFVLWGVGAANADSHCLAFGRPCACVWHARECLPTCHIAPRLECEPTNYE
jgi:hypothetical protein